MTDIIKTGFKDLDDQVSILKPGHLIVVAGRPAMGKTAFVISIASHIIIDINKKVLFFRLDNNIEQTINRIFCHVFDCRISGEDDEIVFCKIESESRCVFSIAENLLTDGHTDLISIINRCKEEVREEGIKLLIIDYLQLIKFDKDINISTELKNLAVELNIPIICTSQLSRKPEERFDKRPVITDLIDYYPIEQNIDTFISIYREEYYNEDSISENVDIHISTVENNIDKDVDINLSFKKETASFKKETTSFKNF